jgi:hypothetical protein
MMIKFLTATPKIQIYVRICINMLKRNNLTQSVLKIYIQFNIDN